MVQWITGVGKTVKCHRRNRADCWGVCKWCNGKGHQAEKCRFKKDAEAKDAEKARKAEANRKKKTKKQAMKKKKKEGANKAAVDLPGTGGTVTGPD